MVYAGSKWRAQIKFNGKKIHIGYYHFETEAALQYNDKAIELFGAYAKLHVIDLDTF